MRFLRLLYNKLKTLRLTFYYKGLRKYELIIFDDVYPNPISGFRREEFDRMLLHFNNSKIIIKPKSYPSLNLIEKGIGSHVNSAIKADPALKGKLKIRRCFININTELFYCIFLNNIFHNLNWLEKHKIPFIFTLYPGGGFQINDVQSDTKLRQVLSSGMFRKVIVTQRFTRDYLLDNNLCHQSEVAYIYGGVVPQLSIQRKPEKKEFHDNLNICFCAAKNMPNGEDKGYDIFIAVMRKIITKFNNVHCHVIGGFNENDIDVTEFKDKIHFYGYQEFEKLSNIFRRMHIIISPNRPFILNKGSFDGFPLGTVVEAVFNGCVAIVTDSLKQNEYFVHNEDIIIVDHDQKTIENEIIDLIHNRNRLNSISSKGKIKFKEIFSHKNQLQDRFDLLRDSINKSGI